MFLAFVWLHTSTIWYSILLELFSSPLSLSLSLSFCLSFPFAHARPVQGSRAFDEKGNRCHQFSGGSTTTRAFYSSSHVINCACPFVCVCVCVCVCVSVCVSVCACVCPH